MRFTIFKYIVQKSFVSLEIFHENFQLIYEDMWLLAFGLYWFCMVRKLLSFYDILNFEFCEISKNTFLTEHLWTTAADV